MDIVCPNYEVAAPRNGSETILTFEVDDVLSQGATGGNPVRAGLSQTGAWAVLEDGTRLSFPNIPPHLRALLNRHLNCWICGLRREGAGSVVQWAGLVFCESREPGERRSAASA